MQLLAIPFKNERVDMYFFMHKKMDSSNIYGISLKCNSILLAICFPILDEKVIEKLIVDAVEMKVQFAIPEFKIEYEYPLKKVIQQLGAKRIFGDAQFNISETAVSISDILHKAYIKV